MRRILTTLVTGATVIALATPATVSAAVRDDSIASSKSALTTAVAAPANAAPGKSQLRSSIDRAVSTVLASSSAASQQPGPVTRKGTTQVRAQGGGGGKTGMIIG